MIVNVNYLYEQRSKSGFRGRGESTLLEVGDPPVVRDEISGIFSCGESSWVYMDPGELVHGLTLEPVLLYNLCAAAVEKYGE